MRRCPLRGAEPEARTLSVRTEHPTVAGPADYAARIPSSGKRAFLDVPLHKRFHGSALPKLPFPLDIGVDPVDWHGQDRPSGRMTGDGPIARQGPLVAAARFDLLAFHLRFAAAQQKCVNACLPRLPRRVV